MVNTPAFKKRIFLYHTKKLLALGKVESLCIYHRGVPVSTHVASKKVFFKCSGIDTRTRTTDMTASTASIKSWLFQDQLVKPEDFLLYRKRADGGLGLIHPKVKAHRHENCSFGFLRHNFDLLQVPHEQVPFSRQNPI